ncbi:phage adaptor protein [Cupriavidus numazuensis]|uniref:Uncharacterized protein n=1 Tax=Cupriavidus numazuensis TaxID=221992 RepID=A0ABN7PRF8_9BURK|nr:hypothetical protein [Cupriavidus numazuensis]CAG2132522.1 hypothetical protein LMG26411_00632 [Cupriavidus numazuensis]
MSTTKYTDLFNEVLPELPGVGQDLAANAIRNTIIEFCHGSWAWRYFMDPMPVLANLNTYELDPPPGAEVVQALVVKVDGKELPPSNETDVTARYPRWQTEAGTPKCYLTDDPSQIILAPVPDTKIPGGLVVTVALQPTRTSTTFPTWIWSRYFDGLAAGAKARLMAMPGKPWTSPQLFQLYRGQFEAAMAGAKVESLKSLSRGALRTTSYH